MTLTIFQVLDGINSNQLVRRLRRVRPQVDSKINNIDGDYVDLTISIDEITSVDNGNIHGTMTYDVYEQYRDRTRDRYNIKTRFVDFTFVQTDRWFLIIYAASKESKIIVQNFSRMVFLTQPPSVLPCDIIAPTMENFLDQNPHTLFRCNWDELNIPGLTGTELKGGGVEQTRDFTHFDRHGIKKSIQFNLTANNITLSMNRNAGIHFYTTMNRDSMESFIIDRILPLCR